VSWKTFAQDLPMAERKLLAATQGPTTAQPSARKLAECGVEDEADLVRGRRQMTG